MGPKRGSYASVAGPVVNCRAVRSNDLAEQIKGKFWEIRETLHVLCRNISDEGEGTPYSPQ